MALGRGQSYGLSARGLAIGTGTPRPEEFPRFRAFWLERPQPRGNTLVIHALLDSRSTTGAFRFTVRPGDTTVMDVESIVFPRIAIQEIGVAPLTSMYYFSGRDHARPDAVRPDDWRAAVHDSDGLGVATGRNERLWRPLVNPTAVQFSAFMDANPRGFGLMQRKRAFTDFGDLQKLYGRRPSLWIEPIGDWGVGAVDLVEIPTNSEYNDNIVAFWRGTEPLRAGGEYNFTYRMHWGADAPLDARLTRIVEMRTGAGTAPGTRVFVAVTMNFGVVQNPPFWVTQGARKPPACESRISVGRVSCAGGGEPPRVKFAGAAAAPGPAGRASADDLGRSSTPAGSCPGARHAGCA